MTCVQRYDGASARVNASRLPRNHGRLRTLARSRRCVSTSCSKPSATSRRTTHAFERGLTWPLDAWSANVDHERMRPRLPLRRRLSKKAASCRLGMCSATSRQSAYSAGRSSRSGNVRSACCTRPPVTRSTPGAPSNPRTSTPAARSHAV
eukprot:scaffold69942_cov87-Phaeocystis_antarctica.AAC.7